jgi:uroporphyrinogen III methyltransferase/synthase
MTEEVKAEEIARLLEGPQIDFITFTSSATVKNFINITGAEGWEEFKSTKIVCIGPVTAGTAEKLGLKVAAVADIYTIDGLVNTLVRFEE